MRQLKKLTNELFSKRWSVRTKLDIMHAIRGLQSEIEVDKGKYVLAMLDEAIDTAKGLDPLDSKLLDDSDAQMSNEEEKGKPTNNKDDHDMQLHLHEYSEPPENNDTNKQPQTPSI